MGATETRSASSFNAKTASLAVVALKDKAYCKYLPANLEVAKKRLLDCHVFLPNFLYFRKSVVKKLRVKSFEGYLLRVDFF